MIYECRLGEQVIRAGLSALGKGSQSDIIMRVIIRRLAMNHTGFEALLLPLVDEPASAELLHQQCQLALRGPEVRVDVSEPRCDALAPSCWLTSAALASPIAFSNLPASPQLNLTAPDRHVWR